MTVIRTHDKAALQFPSYNNYASQDFVKSKIMTDVVKTNQQLCATLKNYMFIGVTVTPTCFDGPSKHVGVTVTLINV
jgi:hypothetical protein